MIENPESHALEPFDFNHLLENVPKLKMLNFDIAHYEFSHPLDSSAMNPKHWGDIARVIEQNYSQFDGFVVLHGTDTMAYTASALSYMLEGLNKPVILTGSQLPIGEVRTDGEENLITALQIAAAQDCMGGPMVREVAILFDDYLWRGNRSTKHSSDNFNAFQSNNYPPLARVGLNIIFNKEQLLRPDMEAKFHVQYDMDCSMMCLDLFPGMNEELVRYIFNAPGVKGIVLKTFGAGNGPNTTWFIDTIREAISQGKVVVNVTQCGNGCVVPTLYGTGRDLASSGLVSGHDLTTEAAITKLMYLFGKGLTPAEVAAAIEVPICGELTEEE